MKIGRFYWEKPNESDFNRLFCVLETRRKWFQLEGTYLCFGRWRWTTLYSNTIVRLRFNRYHTGTTQRYTFWSSFEQFVITWLINSSNFHFWSAFISSNWIKSDISNKLGQVIINFEKKSGWIKSETACICFTWLPPSHSKLDQNVYPRVDRYPIGNLNRHLLEIRYHINLYDWW